ncbi:MAG: helix-turn-helix domain-containing protein [Acidimicrobiia bacterium]|nr:MAG: helix-turn-helix domain-containing protein [Acidimicrobiia bacterium]
MDTAQFDRQVSDLASALGDTTRRGIYVAVRESTEPVTVSEIAELFTIHANVARHHLDHLVADGYLCVSRRRPEGRSGPGAGRPAKHYESTSKDVSVQFPALRYDLLAELLLRVVNRIAPVDAGDIAEEVGREYGRELAAELGFEDDAGYEAAARAVATAMMGVGFEIEARPGEHRLVTRHCPFGGSAEAHPDIVCRLDQGLVSGLLERTNQPSLVIVTPHGGEDETCLTEI